MLKNKIQLNRFGDLVGFIKLFTNWTASVIQQVEMLLGVVKRELSLGKRVRLGVTTKRKDYFLPGPLPSSEESGE